MKVCLLDKRHFNLPQNMTMLDYPILVQKSVSPDNKEIVITHLANKFPKRTIHLGKWEIISFIDGRLYYDGYSEDTRKQINMLLLDR